jgi:hypothetical protein
MAWNYDPKHWCERAQEMRSIAAKLKDPQAKAKMLRVCQRRSKITSAGRSKKASRLLADRVLWLAARMADLLGGAERSSPEAL